MTSDEHKTHTSQDHAPRIKRVECGICETAFTDGTVVEIAKKVASHWNDEHGDEFHGVTPYKTEEYQGHHLHGNEYSYRVYEYYITAYDVLDTSGHSTGPFAYEYVKEPDAFDHCEDCWRSVESADGYQELPTDGWRDKYICNECKRQREIEKHREQNQKITEFAP